MKNIIIFSVFGIFFSSCSSMQFNEGDAFLKYIQATHRISNLTTELSRRSLEENRTKEFQKKFGEFTTQLEQANKILMEKDTKDKDSAIRTIFNISHQIKTAQKEISGQKEMSGYPLRARL